MRKAGPASAGAVSKEDFTNQFLEVPKVSIQSIGDVKAKIETIIKILSKTAEDWEKRNTQLKLVRAIVIHGENVIERTQLISQLVRLTDPLEISVKDLRSQVMREASITCSFLMEKYGNELHQVGEQVLPAALAQVAVSTKIMATSGAILSAFIVQHVQTKQVFTTITSYATSKDKNQRRQLSTLLEVVIEHWSDKMKSVYMGQIRELIKKSIGDPDSETRIHGRKAFSKLDEMHPEEADKIYQTVESSKQKYLRGGEGAGGSTASVGSERGTMPYRSKLSAGSMMGRPGAVPNISAKFLSQRSASAIDTKQFTRPMTTMGGTPNLKYPARPITTRTMSKVDTSPGGSKFARPQMSATGMGPRTNSNLRSRPATGSQPSAGSRNTSPPPRGTLPPEMQRVKSNLGANSFVSTLTPEQAATLHNQMNQAREQMRQPSRNDDDEFLLIKRPMVKTPQKSALEMSRVEAAVRACCSTSENEKRAGVKQMATIVKDSTLSDSEVKSIGQTLTRLVADVSNSVVLESVSDFVKVHHSRLHEWLRVGLHKLFQKKASESTPIGKKQVSATLDAILSSFDPNFQWKTCCDLICDPVMLLPPKARFVIVEYMNDLLSKHMEPGSTFGEKVKPTLNKMFYWMTEPRHGQVITPITEKTVCSMFALNAAGFAAVLKDFNPDYRDWAQRILQQHGCHEVVRSEEEEACVRTNIFDTAAQIEDFVANRKHDLHSSPAVSSPRYAMNSASAHHKLVSLGPLRTLNSELNGSKDIEQELSLNESLDRLKLNSRVEDMEDESAYVIAKIEQLSDSLPENQYEGLSAIHSMLCEGSFTLWEQNFAKLMIGIFDILSKSESDQNKKMALRVLTKMCTSQAARLFDSTEMAVCKVLDASVDSKDMTINVAADDCLKTLATHLPLTKIVYIAKSILNQEPLQEDRAGLVLKMMTRLFEGMDVEELTPIVDEVAPCALKAYESPTSAVRKTAVYCLVAMVNKIGMAQMEPHLLRLSSTKRNLIQVYIQRAMSASAHSHV